MDLDIHTINTLKSNEERDRDGEPVWEAEMVYR